MRLTLITGGAASGKSTRALRLASGFGPRVLFIATCVPRDDEMRAKVARHQAERPATWQTVEATRSLRDLFREGFDGAVVDCLTLLLSQLLVDQTPDAAIYDEIRSLCEAARRASYPVVIVTNEVGAGVVPEHPLGRRFREVAGRCNQLAASLAHEVEWVVCGTPVKVKDESCEAEKVGLGLRLAPAALTPTLSQREREFERSAGSLHPSVPAIPPLDTNAMSAARRRLGALTKPPGSLGRLEELAIQLAGITGRVPPVAGEKTIFLFAADHGVTAEGVSAYPASVTGQMVGNFLRGGAAINVLAKQCGASLVVVDVGVAAEIPANKQLVASKIAWGTRNFVHEPAMTPQQAWQAIDIGRAAFRPCHLAGMGEMGIGNSTSAAAIVAAATGRPPAEVVGRGTGIDDATLARKTAAVEKALALHRPDPGDGLSLLASVGGFEIGALAGAMLAAAAARVPIVLDGFISTAAALIAVRLSPAVRGYLIAAHRSAEKGHALALARLGLSPLLDLEMRLGEGTGAALAFPILEAACRMMSEMATFAEAGVTEREGQP
ncbi:MAG TPA: nicotinate-nucleotide--dimethylbenzimidazole phosphoribosyltransferase [Pirellulales bacterium]|jgi:nicotinate-nucleotide--dimethylbenzimidazole phosphoribosyltransferase|nr:nicotinate-nucleotide--dimethylbenzimidazole phosphoribosyltransferase [Pirellulales bacterium]